MHIPNVCKTNGDFISHHHDTKFYKNIKLPNDLQCVLISSNSNDDNTASIALSIRTGSFDDPKEYEGLAHLMSNLIIRETKFLERVGDNEEELIEDEVDEEIVEEKMVGNSNRVKRSRPNKIEQNKKIARQQNKKVDQAPKIRQINGLMYKLNAVKGTIKLITEYEFTTFQIDLPTENLKSILEDFYLRFKCEPTFSEYLINETLKQLRQDYFQKMKENAMMALKMLLCNLVEEDALKNYPSNPFLEIKTDADANRLREKLLDFFHTFYQANRMKLILKSNLSIEVMERLLNESFGNLKVNPHIDSIDCDEQVKQRMNKMFLDKEIHNMFYIKPHNKNLNIGDFLPIKQDLMINLDYFEEQKVTEQLEEKLADENSLDKIISNKITYDNNNLIFNYTSQRQIQSKENEKKANQLCFVFQVPYDKNSYPLMPLHFISSLICKDGPGTLMSYLRKRDLMITIKSGNLPDCNFSNNNLWNLFFVKIYLTKKGMLMINEIIKFFNSYLAMLMKLENLESLFKEFRELISFKYDFKEIRSQSSHDLFVAVKKMHSFPIKHLFVANRIPLCKGLGDHLDLIKYLMKHFRLENSIIAILSDEANFNEIDTNNETFKGVDLKRVPVDRLSYKHTDLFKVEDFPKKNLFLKNNLKIHPEPKVYYVPERINENANAQLWYKKECSELLSLTSINLLISNNDLKKNSKLASCCDLVVVISKMQTQDLLFQVREAGFLYRVEFNRFGFNISATGNDEINNVFKKILRNFKNPITDEMLKNAKKIAIKNYENAMMNKLTVYLDTQNSMLFKNQFTLQERKAELDNITLKDIDRMLKMLFDESKREYLIQGNCRVRDAHKFFVEIERMFDDIGENVQMKQAIKSNETEYNETTNKPDDISSSNMIRLAHSRNESFPIPSTEYYSLVQLIVDSFKSDRPWNDENNQSFSYETPDSSYTFKLDTENRRYIESTCLKPGPNRKLFNMDASNVSKIEEAGTSSQTKHNLMMNSVCNDITNVDYVLSPLNNSNDNQNFSAISQQTQIVGNLYFTDYDDDVKHSILLRLLVELIKQNMNGFFTNEQNLRDDFFQAGKSDRNSHTPEITFQDHVVIDGQIECVEFEMINSKGFIFIVFDDYHLLNTKSIDNFAESFLGDFMIERVIEPLTQKQFDVIIESMIEELNKKLTWSQDVKCNWNEIMIGKRRFDLKDKKLNVLERKINLNFFKRWAHATLAKMNRHSKLSIQFLKDEQSCDQNQKYSGDNRHLKFHQPQLPKSNHFFIKEIAIDDLAYFKRL